MRRDLRLHDNQALAYALSHAEFVIPLFILDPHLLKNDAPFRKAFLFEALSNLNQKLSEHQSRLIVRAGNPVEEMPKFMRESGADFTVVEADYSPYAKRRDEQVAEEVNIHFTNGLTIRPLNAVLKSNGDPYVVYTPYRRTWKSLPAPGAPLSAPENIHTPQNITSLPIPNSQAFAGFPSSEDQARKRMSDFLSTPIFSYKKDRDMLGRHGTSELSPYIRFGLISMRELAYRAQQLMSTAQSEAEKENIRIWLNELIWRDFYFSIMHHFPFVLSRSFREDYRQIDWHHNPVHLEAWKYGCTGYPVVDAGMRQLLKTGWMHNRARMICASFLVKDLLINWQEGEKWFMHLLIDGDPASNNGGWQWTAGTGTDAAPYFRIFNPITQSKKFDPTGSYIRRWLNELEHIPDKYIHVPWQMPPEVQKMSGVRIGMDYPAPLVDHQMARDRTLAAYQAAKNQRRF